MSCEKSLTCAQLPAILQAMSAASWLVAALRSALCAHRDLLLEILALRRRQFFVEDDDVGAALPDLFLQLRGFAFADVILGIRRIETLAQRTHDTRTCGVGEVRKLAQVIVGNLSLEAFRGRAYKDDFVLWRFYDVQLWNLWRSCY